jgi:hypothetical protein
MPERRGLFGKFDRRHPLGQELEQVANGGHLYAPRVVEWARRHPQSKLHDEFVWDNTRAGQLYRIEQARRLIRVYIEIPEPNFPEMRAYVSIASDRRRGGGMYRPMREVKASKLLLDQLLAEAYQQMEMFKAKYGILKELMDVLDAMDRTLQNRRRRRPGRRS